jgi:hypothetical protein
VFYRGEPASFLKLIKSKELCGNIFELREGGNFKTYWMEMKFSVYCDVGSYSYSNTNVTGVE